MLEKENNQKPLTLSQTTIWNLNQSQSPPVDEKVNACFANLWIHYYCDMFTCLRRGAN